MNTSEIGNQTEAVILAELVKQGFTVLIPFGGGHRYDLVMDWGNGVLQRAQCKTGRLRNGVILYSTSSKEKKWSAKTTASRQYDGDADIFLIWCPETDKVYWQEVSEVAKDQGRLRVEMPKNGQTKGVRLAEMFEI